MRIYVLILSVVAVVAASSIPSNYIPPVTDNNLSLQEFNQMKGDEAPTSSVNNGYHYKVVRNLKRRLRRDVNEHSAAEYLPPVVGDEEVECVEQPVEQEISSVEAAPEEKTILAEDGYRYKVARRLKYRQRRDVNELLTKEYLPPTELPQSASAEASIVQTVPEVKTQIPESTTNEYLPPSEEIQMEVAVPETELFDDGYRYKTVRRLKYRQRRDVSELQDNKYLPPNEVQQSISEEASVAESIPEVKTHLADDGYHYQTVRRLKYRHRRDVNELPVSEYLPPANTEQPASKEVSVVEPTFEVSTHLPEVAYLPASGETEMEVAIPEVKTELSDDGYRYKTVRRLKYRHRRDVNELQESKYLPPVEIDQAVSEEVSAAESLPEVKTQLADDGYHYKTVRRLKYRQRRDVHELAAEDNLHATVLQQSLPELKTQLAEDGYRYQTVRRLKYRQRRDVDELPISEYLPPTDVPKEDDGAAAQYVAQETIVMDSVPEVKTELADDGYRYKTVRRLKLRQRRDIGELPIQEYLPPTEVKSTNFNEDAVAGSMPETRTELAGDGYRYKTVRRFTHKRQ